MQRSPIPPLAASIWTPTFLDAWSHWLGATRLRQPHCLACADIEDGEFLLSGLPTDCSHVCDPLNGF
jgi:hypothetical protein